MKPRNLIVLWKLIKADYPYYKDVTSVKETVVCISQSTLITDVEECMLLEHLDKVSKSVDVNNIYDGYDLLNRLIVNARKYLIPS